MESTTFTTISKKFNNTRVKRIVNVYQLKYKNGIAQGFGDYIRGCFCLMQICALLGLEFDMNLSNHPISKYLYSEEEGEKREKTELKSELKSEYINYSEIFRYEDVNYIPINSKVYTKDSFRFLEGFINNLNSYKAGDTFYIFCHSFPIFETQEIGRKFVLNKILPNSSMQLNIQSTLMKYELTPRRFAVIHIRSGDKYLLKNNSLNSIVVKKIINILSKNMKPGTKYLILSDNNQIKLLLKKVFPQIVIRMTRIIHLGESTNSTDDSIMDTLLDFYLLGYSNGITAFSHYVHGTGFSKEAAKLFDIPYELIHLDLGK
jgi:hypothetical protein